MAHCLKMFKLKDFLQPTQFYDLVASTRYCLTFHVVWILLRSVQLCYGRALLDMRQLQKFAAYFLPLSL